MQTLGIKGYGHSLVGVGEDVHCLERSLDLTSEYHRPAGREGREGDVRHTHTVCSIAH